MRTLVAEPRPDPAAFAPFGALIRRPDAAGERRFFSDWLGSPHPGCAPVLHVNRMPAARLPHRLAQLERHPHAAQLFVPLGVARYLVVVAPSDAGGRPQAAAMRAFVVEGDQGVVYRAGTWHAGAAVLDREAGFAVLMWRGAPDDDVFAPIEPTEIRAAGADDDLSLRQPLPEDATR